MAKTMTMTIDGSEGIEMPAAEPAFKPFAGFRVTITTPGGNVAALPVENKLVWSFGNVVEGGTYQVKVETVDADGRAIQTVEQSVQAPAAPLTYTRVNGLAFSFS